MSRVFSGVARWRLALGAVALGGLINLLWVASAQAACSPLNALGAPVVIQSTNDIQVSTMVPNDTELATIGPVEAPQLAHMGFATCPGGGDVYWASKAGPIVANRRVAIGSSGLSYSITFDDGGDFGPFDIHKHYNANTWYFSSAPRFIVHIYKAGPLVGGTYQADSGSGHAATFFSGNNGGSSVVFHVNVTGIVLKPVVPSCSFDVPNTVVDYGQIRAQDFSGVGSTVGSALVDIGLSCNGVGFTLGYQLDTDNYVDQAGGVIGLSADSTAGGVGYRVLDKQSDKPAAFGSMSSVAKPAEVLTQHLAFEVKAQQTSATITPGSANALITLTLSYP